MPDWEYKVLEYRRPEAVRASSHRAEGRGRGPYTLDGGRGYTLNKNGYPIPTDARKLGGKDKSAKEVKNMCSKWNEDNTSMDFATWLGHHSREGWEIFKIYRRECVFRRPIE